MPKEYLEAISVKEKTNMWADALSEKSPGINLVLEKDKQIIGFCVFGPARDDDLKNSKVGELVALNILPSYWGKGYGTRMLKFVLNEFKAKKWEALYLWVIQQNKRAISFYQANGLSKEGLEKFDNKLTGHELHEIRLVTHII